MIPHYKHLHKMHITASMKYESIREYRPLGCFFMHTEVSGQNRENATSPAPPKAVALPSQDYRINLFFTGIS